MDRGALTLAERRAATLEAQLAEQAARAQAAEANQHKLAAEKGALIETVRRLNREVARLAHFKRNLLQTLQHEEEVGSQHLQRRWLHRQQQQQHDASPDPPHVCGRMSRM